MDRERLEQTGDRMGDAGVMAQCSDIRLAATKENLRLEQPELRWRGNLGIPGLFDGEHSFVLEAIDARRSRLIHSERFSGLLIPIFSWLAAKQTERAFEAMNMALKARVESPQPA